MLSASRTPEVALVSGALQEADDHHLSNSANQTNISSEDEQDHIESEAEIAASIPLPTPTSTLHTPLVTPIDVQKKQSYRDLTVKLAHHFPHLKNVTKKSRHDLYQAKCYDYCGNSLVSSTPITADANSQDGGFLSAMALKNNIPNCMNLRLIVVQELSSDLIESLGYVFGINPEFFEEHLLNSRWQDSLFEDQESDTWITSGMKKNYMSIKWQRLVKCNLPESEIRSVSTPNSMSIDTEAGASFVYALELVTNTIRRIRYLGSDLEMKNSTSTSALMEEKATVWTSETEFCQFSGLSNLAALEKANKVAVVILLLDPLPRFKSEVSGPLRFMKKKYKDRFPETTGISSISSNVITSSPILSSPHSKSLNKLKPLKKRYFRPFGNASPIATSARLPDEENAKDSRVDEEERGRITITLKEGNIAEDVFLRWPFPDYDAMVSLDSVNQLDKHVKVTRSSATIMDLLLQKNHSELNPGVKFAPIELLFTIIHMDILDFLRSVGSILVEIRQKTLDDILLQKNLLHWRSYLDFVETELESLNRSLQSFACFILQPKDSTSYRSDTEPSAAKSLVNSSLSEISALRLRIAQSYKSLLASISIVESKRGISEAESVTKLTELAFLFIPLSFSASIFGMQVKELNPANVSISAFFIMAFIITTFSYALRLLIRSAFFIGKKRHFMKYVRDDARLSEGDPVPTRLFLPALWHGLLKKMPYFKVLAVIILLLICALIVPLVVLWRRT